MQIFSKLIHSARPAICMGVAAWASGKGYQVKVLHPPMYVTDDRVAQEDFTGHRAALEPAETLVRIEGQRFEMWSASLNYPTDRFAMKTIGGCHICKIILPPNDDLL